MPERKTVGAWHWGQRLDPLESALQVWRISWVSLWSYILVNLMSVIINVRMTERLLTSTLFGPAIFLPHGMYIERNCRPWAMCWCKPGLHSPHNSWGPKWKCLEPVAINFSLPKELITESGYISRTVSATNAGYGSAYCSKPTGSFDVHIVRIP